MDSRRDFSETNWQILGELELMVNSETDLTVHMWLESILHSLNLQTDFLHRIMKSAQGVWSRANQSETWHKDQRAHVLIFVLPEYAAQQNWGFFRIEKLDLAEQNTGNSYLEVEFYLYPEGQ